MATPDGRETTALLPATDALFRRIRAVRGYRDGGSGRSLKRREKISARLGDVLSQLYLCSATLKRFEDEGRPAEDLPLLDWAVQDSLYQIQQAFDGVIRNFPNAFIRQLISALVFPDRKGSCRRLPITLGIRSRPC